MSQKINLWEKIKKYLSKYEEWSEIVAAYEQDAEDEVARRGTAGTPGGVDYEVDTLLNQHAYKRAVAIRNSARDRVLMYCAVLQAGKSVDAVAALNQILVVLRRTEERSNLGVPAQRQI